MVISQGHTWAYRRLQRLAGAYLADDAITKLKRMLKSLNGLIFSVGNGDYGNKDPGGS